MRSLILIIVISFSFNLLYAETVQQIVTEPERSIFDLVNYQEITEVTLELELDRLLADRKSEEDFKAKFSFKDYTGKEQTWKAKVNIRGRFRRIKCTEMPPLKLNFKKGDLADSGLSLFDDFKLVTQCVEDESIAKELLLKEYMAYKIYNEITDYSFRVQFLKINFKDAISGEVTQQWGFIIEDTAQLRARIGGEKYEKEFGINADSVNQDQFKSMALFQYMIGNLDWDVYKKVHNVKLIQKDGQLLTIPYDFDFSGIVAAPYTTFNPKYNIKSFKDRLYLGDPNDLKDMDLTIELFKSKKEGIIELIKSFKILDRDERKDLISFINSFYKETDNIQIPETIPSSNVSINR
jgi:hypothetical protein